MQYDALEAFVQRIHHDIPLTQTMGWLIETVTSNKLRASAPLGPNVNDKGTFFGGASAALMTISAWSLIKYNLEQMAVHNDVVIHQSHNKWLRPQTGLMEIRCDFDETIDWNAVKDGLLNQNKNQHLKLSIQGLSASIMTCSMSADFVILAIK
ncbi:YiiD C-terminal domain-containing protein [Marinicella rhabdoformis]|uniref:YiiD C-terminal domain-containing protein n=1 Tax=Marinicella rhabdoformis TaxID=2580566 RepID=UPI0012AEB9C8|nr:YiiD C-terminal domain-containing protein [Marinicella rhabdoformis]